MVDLKIYSFNVRGIGDQLKRRTVFRDLKKKYTNAIFLLQETHSSPNTEQNWKLEWNGEIYFNHGTSNSCGVATLISPGLDINIKFLEKDDHGRILALIIQTNDENDIAIYNIYAPVRSKVQEQLATLNFIKDVYANTDCLYTIRGVTLTLFLNLS